MTFVIIGCGSIGNRHAKNLLSLGYNDIYFYRNRGVGNELNLPEVRNLCEVKEINPDLTLICNPTSLHFKFLEFCLINNLNILCEKPLVNNNSELKKLAPLIENSLSILRVSFNLRYHPCVIKAKEILDDGLLGKINYSRFFVGQYLPDWRPHINHLNSYSAHENMGGGVLKDLIHEIDLAVFLNGIPVSEIKSMSLKVSDVTVNSEDVAEILFKNSLGGLTNIHLDYLYRGLRRYFMINGEKANLFCDLTNNKIVVDNGHKSILEHQVLDYQKNSMYLTLLEKTIDEVVNKKTSLLPDFMETKVAHEICFNSKSYD